MTTPLLIGMPGNEAMTKLLSQSLGAEIGQVELRTFPDGETRLQFLTDISTRA